MRVILAIAVVFVVMIGVQAQAPTPVMSGSVVIQNGEATMTDVVLRFADGSELRADRAVLPPEIARPRRDTVANSAQSPSQTYQVSGQVGGLKGAELTLSGNVRLKLGN